MSKRREQRPPSRKERRALREIEQATRAIIYNNSLADTSEEQEPTLDQMLDASEGQLGDR